MGGMGTRDREEIWGVVKEVRGEMRRAMNAVRASVPNGPGQGRPRWK